MPVRFISGSGEIPIFKMYPPRIIVFSLFLKSTIFPGLIKARSNDPNVDIRLHDGGRQKVGHLMKL